MKKIMKLISSLVALAAILGFAISVTAEEDWKAKYETRVAENDATIGVIAGVINYVCPKLIPASSAGEICNPEDPVGSAVGVQKYMETNWNKEDDDIEDAEMPELLNKTAALQFWDAVEQFKPHFGYREKAKTLAANNEWQDAFLNEEMAFQYLVKCASRGIFAKKIVDGE
jgi:hypothetical protein